MKTIDPIPENIKPQVTETGDSKDFEAELRRHQEALNQIKESDVESAEYEIDDDQLPPPEKYS